MKLTIDWIRHGQSYSNLFYELKNVINDFTDHDAQIFSAKYAPDAKLTPTGILQARYFNKHHRHMINEYDYIFCSELSRSVETSILISRYTNIKKIYMVPYISEVRLHDMSDYDNEPKNYNVIKYIMDKKYPTSCGYAELDINFIKQYNTPSTPDKYKFYDQIIPLLSKNIDKQNGNVYIGIVSHMEYIYDIFNSNYKFTDRLKNLQFMSETITYRDNMIDRNMVAKILLCHQIFPSYLEINDTIVCNYIYDILKN